MKTPVSGKNKNHKMLSLILIFFIKNLLETNYV